MLMIVSVIMLSIAMLVFAIKLLAIIFSATFTITGFFFKIVLGLILTVVSAILLFSVIGLFSLIIFVPVVLIGIALGRGAY